MPPRPKDGNFNQDDLKAYGLTFKEGAFVWPATDVAGFTMNNTTENHQLLEKFLNERFGKDWKVKPPSP